MSMILSVRAKILIAVVIPILGLLSLAAFKVISERDSLVEARKEMLHELCVSTVAIFDHFHALAEKGQMTDVDAREQAKAVVRDIRYGHDDYMLVYRTDGITEVLGPMPKLEGQQRIDTKDPDGVPFVRMLIDVAKEGMGFVSYKFPRKAGEPPLAKISTAILYKPWNMVVGTGVYIDDIDEAFHRQILQVGGGLAIGVLVVFGLSLAMTQSITGALGVITRQMVQLANGDKSFSVELADRRDEIGKLAKALDVFRRNALDLERQEEARKQAEQHSKEALQEERQSIAGQFEQRVMSIIEESSRSTDEMHQTAQSMTEVANSASAQAGVASSAADLANSNVQTVAAAAEQLASSISEISRQVAEAAHVSADAAQETQRINAMMQELSDAAVRIGEVVKLVNDIASQTNLLALNATIEAARAGDAGKGFAVVAGEVKNLASQTGRATEEITQQIASVQTGTRNAVDAIKGISSVIDHVREISSGIASAVEEQGAATQEIARNVNQAVQGTIEVSENVGGLSRAAGTTGAVADSVLRAAEQMAENATRLRSEIKQFLSGIRAR
ncbi:MAG TPA: cache domain-containing protein [Telmatospirillum sp.]|nr:cache domain-containing protein [Telmatospirillum sp.]